MAISTTSVNERANNGNGTWKDYGSGGNSAASTTIGITPSSAPASRARKVSNSIKGFGLDLGVSGVDFTGLVLGMKWGVLAGVSSLNTRTAGGVQFILEDTSGNEGYFYMDGNDTYTGGFKLSVLDCDHTPTANNGADPTITAIRYVGMRWDITANVGGGDPNCIIDQILTWPDGGIVITGNSTSFIDDLVDAIDNPTNGPYWIFERRGGVVFSKAKTDIQPDASNVSDTDKKLIYENPVWDAGSTIDSCLEEIGIISADADSITFTRCLIESADPDETVTTDADRIFDFTSAADINFNTCQITGFNGTVVHLGGTGNNYDDCTFQRLAQIVDTGAVVRGGFVRDSQCAATEAALLWTSSSDWGGDIEFVMGATNSHAIEVETNNLSDSWDSMVFTGYGSTGGGTTVGDEVFNNQSTTGTVTITATNITGTISYYNRGGGATSIIQNVNGTFDTMKDNSEVRVFTAGTSTELDGIEIATAGSVDNRNFVASIAAGTSVDYTIVNEDWEIIRVEGFTWPSSAFTLPIQQRFDRNKID